LNRPAGFGNACTAHQFKQIKAMRNLNYCHRSGSHRQAVKRRLWSLAVPLARRATNDFNPLVVGGAQVAPQTIPR